MDNLGFKLKALRELHNYKQEYVGSILGLTQTGYSKIEKGEVETVNIKHLQKLSEFYNVSVAQLFDWDGKFQIGTVHNHDNGVVFNQGTINHNDINDRIKNLEDQISKLVNKAL